MVKRFEDWPVRLSAYLRERQQMPFEWGVNDCMAFVAKGVEALTGEDFFSTYSDYSDEESAAEMLSQYGGISGIVTACLGAGSDKVLKAKRGDVVMVQLPESTGGIVDDSGQRIAVVSPNGLLRVPLSKAVWVWGY